MKTAVQAIAAVALIALGALGLTRDLGRFSAHALWFLLPGIAVAISVALRLTYRRSETPWPAGGDRPRPLRLSWLDYVKAAVCWVDAFEHTYAVEPGLYYLGDDYDPGAPLLVTSNYLLTVLLVARRARPFGARLLVVDTDGVNVWCSASKGRFSNGAILAQRHRYDRTLLTGDKGLRLVLPKLAFAGVDLRALRKEKIRPIVGPIYAKDLPEYLSSRPLGDRVDDRVSFGLQSRAFTWLPGLSQYLAYAVAMALIAIACGQARGGAVPLAIVAITGAIATAYPLLFPWLPGRRFAVKGVALGAATSLGLGALAAAGAIGPRAFATAALFALSVGVFVGLTYTGNSPVSAYTKVRRETAQFLPVEVALFAGAVVALFAFGGHS